jgi:hypothetical protein
MTSITLQHIHAASPAGNVTAAFNELTWASRQLISALWTSLTQRSTPRALTVQEEAENLRDLAFQLAPNDPHFAQDLYAAADRHELGANAG